MRDVLLDLAFKAIQEGFGEDVEYRYDEAQYDYLHKNGASFVTLNLDGRLRGCIGSLMATTHLLDDIRKNSKAAAFGDPRFAPLTQSEFERVEIEVSLLSEPKLLDYSDVNDLKKKISKGIDGVVLRLGSYQATFLPQVWEQLPTFELFFSHLCQKAGMSEDCLLHHPQIYIYHVQKFK
jgi:AmmeMemoRadiSam system protein A